jgi:hypothetical protein
MKELESLCGFKIRTQKLLYRATLDGFQATTFHAKCDRISKTLVIIRSTSGNVFGGFTTQTWDGFGQKTDPNAFIFSLINKDGKPEKMPINPSQVKNAVYASPQHGPIFGGGREIIIYDCSNANSASFSTFEKTFMTNGPKTNEYLAGTKNFCVSEIEVYNICDGAGGSILI